jgi:N-acetylmuramoyl-L-alanine amidase
MIRTLQKSFLILIFSLGLPGQQEKISVLENDRKIGQLDIHWQGPVVYIPVIQLADVLNFNVFISPVNKKVGLSRDQHEILLTPRNPFMLVDKQPVQMPSPPLPVGQHLYVPLSFFVYATQNIFPRTLKFDQSRLVLEIESGGHSISGIRIEPMKNGSLIHILTGRSFRLEDISLAINRNWLNVTVYSGEGDSTALASTAGAGIIEQVVPYCFKNSIQLSFRMNRHVEYREVDVKPGEILVSLRTTQNNLPVSGQSLEDRKRWLIDTIILDPGHGGRDPGAPGKTTKEKEVTLEIALCLKDYLNRALPDVRVIMTRDSDKTLGLRDRTECANENKGKLFISIHANANESPRARGVSTYFLGQHRSKQAMEVVQKENSAVQFEKNPEIYKEYEGIDFILKAIEANIYMKESEQLAALVNRSICDHTGIPDQGVHQAGFWVLVGAAMPSILVETAFISNRYEERLLKTRSFQRKIANAIGESIMQFKEKYEKGIGEG